MEKLQKSECVFSAIEIDFEANCYCYSRYMGVSKIGIICLRMSFWLFSVLYYAKYKVNNWLHKGK